MLNIEINSSVNRFKVLIAWVNKLNNSRALFETSK